jgi:hypothetical protein
MPKVQSRGKVMVDGKEVDLKDVDDLGYFTKDNKSKDKTPMSKAVEDELEQEVLRQTGHSKKEKM